MNERLAWISVNWQFFFLFDKRKLILSEPTSFPCFHNVHEIDYNSTNVASKTANCIINETINGNLQVESVFEIAIKKFEKSAAEKTSFSRGYSKD